MSPLIWQLNDTTTVFLGGNNKPTGIYIYSWITKTYQLQSVTLIRSRVYSGCAPFKNANGQVKLLFYLLDIKFVLMDA